MSAFSGITEFREQSRHHEAELPSAQRKALGQFFTGLPLGRVLAHLALEPQSRAVVDPFGGTGDLLDAVHGAADDCDFRLERLDAIEYDRPTAQFCDARLSVLTAGEDCLSVGLAGDAFIKAAELPLRQYDLVITNPPYVRYQSLNGRAAGVRENLQGIVQTFAAPETREVWTSLVSGYSGLADLSVPAWLLSAMLVRPEGRLALVVPATWRTREYADVIRYLMLRCFRIEAVVEDTQPGWFTDAQVRTHLIVARRLPEDAAAVPVLQRSFLGSAPWFEISPEASSEYSLLGTAFPVANSERAFARMRNDATPPTGIKRRTFDFANEWQDLCHLSSRKNWLARLEPAKTTGKQLPTTMSAARIPEPVSALLRDKPAPQVASLDEVGIFVGQGLRTGCNRFFYVRAVGKAHRGMQPVELDPAYGREVIEVPAVALRPVLHRQADLPQWCRGHLPDTRALDLRRWIHPDDLRKARSALEQFEAAQEPMPQVMFSSLAAYVERAAREKFASGKSAPELSAVRTNVRAARPGVPPRFWYMLPDFQPRHEPLAFAPRIIHEEPCAYANTEPLLLIDANFSTFWSPNWPTEALASLLNSGWCRVNMEALGTPLGGGALKLEAVQLRKLPVPKLDEIAIGRLASLWQPRSTSDALEAIDGIVLSAVFSAAKADEIRSIAGRLYEGMTTSITRRRRGRHDNGY